MPAISKIRFTNIVYEDGNKRYNDDTFVFDGENGAILLENGGGKTVFIQTALQAIIPHANMASRKIKETLTLDEPAHIAIEWIISDRPRRYALTAVTLFRGQDQLDSYRFVTEYAEGSTESIDHLPFVKEVVGGVRTAEKGEILEYYRTQTKQSGRLFETITGFREYIEQNYQIIAKEWESIVKINSAEGDIEKFFEKCETSQQLFEKLLIPTVEHAMYFNKEETFVDSFSARRKGFKIHRQMSETIREHEQIKDQLTTYKETFSKLHAVEKSFYEVKQQARSTASYHQEMLKEQEGKQLENEHAITKANEQLNEYAKQRASFEVLLQQEIMDNKEVVVKNAEAERDAVHLRYGAIKQEILSLKVASEEDKILRAEGKIQAKQEELAYFDQQLSDVELRDERAHNLRGIKGYFLELEETFEKEIAELQREKTYFEQLLVEEETRHGTLAQQERKTSEETIQRETEVIGLQAQQREILNALTMDRDSETVGDVKKRLEIQTTTLDQKINEKETNNRQLAREVKVAEQTRERLYKDQTASSNEVTGAEKELEQMKQVHQSMIDQLQVMQTRWYTLDSVYRQEETIRGSIQNELQYLATLKTEKLQKERLALRYVDDYEQMEQFFADSYIDEQIEQWQNQFDFLETGTRFLSQLDVSLEDQVYPYWPITLVTTTDEVTKLVDKIKAQREKIQYPLLVLSLDEANALVQGEEEPTLQSVVPLHWDYHTEIAHFTEWKQNLRAHADITISERQQVEETLAKWKNVEQQLIQFLNDYPQTIVFEKEEHVRLLTEDLLEIEQQIKAYAVEIDDKNDRIRMHQGQLKNDRDSLHHLTDQLKEAIRHEQFSQQVEEKQKHIHALQETLHQVQTNLQKAHFAVQRNQEALGDRKDRLSSKIRDKKTKLDDHALYQHSKEINQPIFSTKRIEQLATTYESITRQLANQSTARELIQQEIDRFTENKREAAERLKQLLAEDKQITKIALLPSNVADAISQLTKRRHEESQLLSEKEQLLKSAEHAFTKQQTLFEQKENSYQKKYAGEPLASFTEPLQTVKQTLQKEKARLAQLTDSLYSEQEKVIAAVTEMKKVVQDYDVLNGKFEFHHPDIEKVLLAEEERLELIYNAKTILHEIAKQLEEAKDAHTSMADRLTKEKEQFIRFCHQSIQDSKLRDHTIQGLTVHTKYEDINQFSAHMLARIANAIQVAETTMKEKDQELEQFIHRMYTHVAKVVDELKAIPKKTRVKTADGRPEIYRFSIPEWQEHEAKQAIRAYVERLGQRLEHVDFKDASGIENATEIKEEIQKTLNTQQLLNVIVQQKRLKAFCRKVTNDLSVTSQTYPWEQSNKWSGGEKWSKNMTLFLGILNYIAEKNQDVRSSKKRNRTVIVDNPFGKASSEHVLQPVFYIAEQLGFQMIALTAHAEGKFLSDYFPVIYSCRLRQAVNSSKQIVDKEKQVQTAYFEDSDPDTLARLGEREQLQLFASETLN